MTFDGTPVETGSISFEPQDGTGAEFGGIIEAGKYVVAAPPGAMVGKKIVRIRASRKTGKQSPAGPPFPPDVMVDEIMVVPAVYNDNSTLTVDLQTGQPNRADFQLLSTPLPP